MMKLMSDARSKSKRKMIVLPEMAMQLFWLSWRASIESGVKIQISDIYQKVMSKTDGIPELSEMFGRQSLGRLPRLCLRQLCFGMPNDMISKMCLTIRK